MRPRRCCRVSVWHRASDGQECTSKTRSGTRSGRHCARNANAAAKNRHAKANSWEPSDSCVLGGRTEWAAERCQGRKRRKKEKGRSLEERAECAQTEAE